MGGGAVSGIIGESELQEALHLADRLLDVPYADPDDELRLLSRHLLRQREVVLLLTEVVEWKSLYRKAEMGWYAEWLVACVRGLPEPESAEQGRRWYERYKEGNK
jgi:hypothetical protein